MRVREPRYIPIVGLESAVTTSAAAFCVSGTVLDLSCNGLALKVQESATVANTGIPVIVELKAPATSGSSESYRIEATIVWVSKDPQFRFQTLHISFREPTSLGRPGRLATHEVRSSGIPDTLSSDFVNSELAWRSSHIQHRTTSIFSAAKLYLAAIAALLAYLVIGLNLLGVSGTQVGPLSFIANQNSSLEARLPYAAGGIAFSILVVLFGAFLMRYSGYVFASNIMNRKRMITLRGSYAKSRGVSGLIPPPWTPDEVFIVGGYAWFPYVFAVSNICLLFLNTAFFYMLFQDFQISVFVSAGMVWIALAITPHVCHRFSADIFCAKYFLGTHRDFPEMPTNTQKQLKDLYYAVLKKREATSRRWQRPLLCAYWILTLVVAILLPLWIKQVVVFENQQIRLASLPNHLAEVSVVVYFSLWIVMLVLWRVTRDMRFKKP